MSELQLKKMSKDLIDRAEQAPVAQDQFRRWVDDYFVEQMKRAEMEHAEVDIKVYEGLRSLAQRDLGPLFQQYQNETNRILERSQNRKLWRYVLGTVSGLEILEAFLTRGRSLLPQILLPTAVLYCFLGFLLYAAARYLDDLQLRRARRRLESALDGLDRKLQTDVEYDNRRQLLQADVLRAEVLEIVAHYDQPEDFWREYIRVREADPTAPTALPALAAPAFNPFLKFHVQGTYSAAARQQRFNRLFLEAQEVFVSRDRDGYALRHLQRPLAAGESAPANVHPDSGQAQHSNAL